MQGRTVTAIFAVLLPVGSLFAQSNVNPTHKWAWGENIGWTNWRHGAEDPSRISEGVYIADRYLEGFVWAENVGWINVGNGDGPYANDPNDSSTFGVNLDQNTPDPNTDELFGFGWGENIGWVNFDTREALGPFGQQARLVDECRFRGYAWGENVGWINLDHEERFVAKLINGDVDQDGDVDLSDLSALLASYRRCVGDPDYNPDADLDDSGCVDLADLAGLLSHYGEECP